MSSLEPPPTLLALAGWRRRQPGRGLGAALARRLAVRAAFAEWSDGESEKH